MSYLLTDVALQMMGYRFFDVRGVPQEMSIQLGGIPTEEQPNPNYTGGPHLSEILGIDLSQHEPTSSRAGSISAIAVTSKMDDDVVFVDERVSEVVAACKSNFASNCTSKGAVATTSHAAPAIGIEAQSSKTLADLSKEYKAVIDGLMQTHDFVMNGVQRDNKNYKRVQEVFFQQEKQELQQVLQITGNYREMFENAITNDNPDSLAQYDAIFD